MSELLTLPFFQHALLAIVLLSLLTGVVGSLIVVNRMLFLAGGIAHSSYGGIGAAIFFGIPIYLGATAFALLATLFIAYLSYRNQKDMETLVGIVWAAGMAIGIIFIDLTPGYQSDVMGYLFGSILAVSRSDLWMMGALASVTLLFVALQYRKILLVSYDSELAKLSGIYAKSYYIAIMLLASLTIVAAIKVVGLILVIALLSIPVYIAQSISKSLWGMMWRASLLSLLFGIGGLFISYFFDVSSGAVIILLSACGALLFSLTKALLKR